MLKRIITPLLFLTFAWFIVSNNDAKIIIASIAIFLIGMHYMENGFKLFSRGLLETFLEKFTRTTLRAIGTGFLATTVVQSSSSLINDVGFTHTICKKLLNSSITLWVKTKK